MSTFPSDLQEPKREHPLITLGVVMAVLLTALLALPFLTRMRQHSPQRHAVSTAPATPARP
jgi:hypothetical protein